MKIASVSFWHLHGTDYAKDAQAHPDVDLVAAWDSDAERGMAAAQVLGIPFVPDLDTILGDSAIEGVIVCSPTSEHTELVIRCIRAGKHVFMEKVLSADLAGAGLIVDAARAQGTALTVSMWRSNCGYAQQIADLVSCGMIGSVTAARVRDGHPFALPMTGHPTGLLPPQFYNDNEARGGTLIDLCHPLYLLTKIVGLPKNVTATLGSVTGHGVEDNAAVVFAYEGGAVAVAETSYVTRITPFTIEVHGTEGSVLYSEPGIGALVAGRERTSPITNPGPDDEPRLRYWSTRTPEDGWRELDIQPDGPTAFDQWVRHALTGTRDEGNADLALALSALVEASYASAAEGRRIAVQSL